MEDWHIRGRAWADIAGNFKLLNRDIVPTAISTHVE